MKESLREELLRIHKLTYGEQVLTEEGFLKNILNKIGLTKSDDPKKADLVLPNLNDFYQTLQEAVNSGGLTQQQYGSMDYQKGVESMQIGLMFLGYPLPRFGVDGLYGPETANAVAKFNQDANIEQSSNASKETISKMIELLQQKGLSEKDISMHIDPVETGGGANFTDLDLSTNEGISAYATICQKFIDTNPPNPLKITGDMLALSASKTYGRFRKYVPPELALSQLKLEGGIGDPNIRNRPVSTRNPFNVGNTDMGQNVMYNSVQNGIDRYYTLIATSYLGKGKTAADLINNFVNKSDNRYAQDVAYETKLNSIAREVNNISRSVLT